MERQPTIWDLLEALVDIDCYAVTKKDGELHVAPIDKLPPGAKLIECTDDRDRPEHLKEHRQAEEETAWPACGEC